MSTIKKEIPLTVSLYSLKKSPNTSENFFALSK
ncbi:hypothetical protein CDSM653_01019 [Caldanaerobacter subterraneus subsp. pacificus DSM 12653]|uniref:Uncharacterized protein n=1 Tax=Caldanaerobacter subterraneus subsp. pacificus DSM 12653 TaxID=391606 RepID=A0A0F5PMT7_9THEO|nr:hypothetical protein CDSM653_01019 [Caldanaerobacter subterraneus subsp. pacificus DSM 12653]